MLDLLPRFDALLENAELVTDAVADRRQFQRGQGVHETGGQATEAAIAQPRVAFGVENEEAGTEEVVVLFELDGPADAGGARNVEDDVRRAIARQSDCVARTVAALPPMWLVKTSSGKISRTRCREKFLKEFK